jgi:regulator of replication initiation timing
MMEELDRLEARVRAVAEHIGSLREETERLDLENKNLQLRLRKLEETAAKSSASDAKPRLQALEAERATLLDERRAMARRVEEMLAKLDVLERAVQT